MGITELVELVRAGLTEDEQLAREATPGPWQARHRGSEHQVHGGAHPLPGLLADNRRVHLDGGYPADWPKDVVNPEVDADHIARHDPQRVLAEVAAKRQLLDQALGWEHGHAFNGEGCPVGPCLCGRDERVLAVLQTLATPYQETT